MWSKQSIVCLTQRLLVSLKLLDALQRYDVLFPLPVFQSTRLISRTGTTSSRYLGTTRNRPPARTNSRARERTTRRTKTSTSRLSKGTRHPTRQTSKSWTAAQRSSKPSHQSPCALRIRWALIRTRASPHHTTSTYTASIAIGRVWSRTLPCRRRDLCTPPITFYRRTTLIIPVCFCLRIPRPSPPCCPRKGAIALWVPMACPIPPYPNLAFFLLLFPIPPRFTEVWRRESRTRHREELRQLLNSPLSRSTPPSRPRWTPFRNARRPSTSACHRPGAHHPRRPPLRRSRGTNLSRTRSRNKTAKSNTNATSVWRHSDSCPTSKWVLLNLACSYVRVCLECDWRV